MQNFRLTISNLACERDERPIFSRLSAEFASGDLVQIAGPNGAGKTTLLKVVIGIVPPAAGEVVWHSDDPDAKLREHLLYLGHQPAVKSSLTALENLQWYFGLNGRKSPQGSAPATLESCVQALNTVGLAGYEHIPCHQMSAGQQRRVALARLFISEAPLWILDEPFTAIDKKGVAALEAQMEAHARRGGMVLLTTHQPLALTGVKLLDVGDYQFCAQTGAPLTEEQV